MPLMHEACCHPPYGTHRSPMLHGEAATTTPQPCSGQGPCKHPAAVRCSCSFKDALCTVSIYQPKTNPHFLETSSQPCPSRCPPGPCGAGWGCAGSPPPNPGTCWALPCAGAGLCTHGVPSPRINTSPAAHGPCESRAVNFHLSANQLAC